jgi:predicted deacylase
MAAAIAENVLPHIDAMVDYHCGGDTSIDYTLVNSDRTPEQRRIFDYTRLIGTEFVFVHDADPFSGTIDQYVKSLGKLSIVAEQGGNVMPDGFLELSMTRVDNFLKGLGMIEGEPELPATQLVMRSRVLIRADHGGLFYPSVGIEGLAAIVEGGTLLSRVVDPHTFEVLQEIRAPYAKSALLMTRPGFSRVNPGDYVYIIADGDSGERVPAPTNWRITL